MTDTVESASSARATQVVDTVTVSPTWVPFPRRWTRLAGDDSRGESAIARLAGDDSKSVDRW